MEILFLLIPIGAIALLFAFVCRAATGMGEASRSVPPGWLRKAAEAGQAASQYEMGRRLAAGEGVQVDLQEAIRWFRRAAEQGFPRALVQVAILVAREDSGLTEDETRRILRDAARRGNREAQRELGTRLLHGDGNEAAEAARWFGEAAKQGCRESEEQYGTLLTIGHGVMPDRTEGARWIRKAAEHGSGGAAFKLGKLLSKGIGVQQDDREAYFWLCIAVNRVPHEEFNSVLNARDAVGRQLSPWWRRRTESRAAAWSG